LDGIIDFLLEYRQDARRPMRWSTFGLSERIPITTVIGIIARE
jgi:hypothetical protein